MSFWMGVFSGLGVWMFINSIACVALSGESVTYNRRIAFGYLLASGGLFIVANLIHLGII